MDKRPQQGNMKPKAKKRKKKRLRAFIILSAFLVLALCLAGLSYSFLMKLNQPAESGTLTDVTSGVGEDGIVNILVSGVDIGDATVELSDDQKRTDTIILVNYNPNTDALNIVSIPRDTLVQIKGHNQKINASNIVGGEGYLTKAVEDLLDIDINYTARVNYEGFRKLIDALGGVDMYISRNMYYDDASQNLHIYFKKGTTVHLDGEKAEEFFRWRQNNDGTGFADGDLGRINNQHLFIEKVIEKVKTPTIIAKIPTIMSIVPKYVTTSMKPEEMLKYAVKFSNVDKSKIVMSTLQGTTPTIGGVSYFVYSEELNTELLASINGENAGSEETEAAELDRSAVSIEVLNGTTTTGLASGYAAKLKESGYTSDIAVGNGDKSAKSKIELYGVDESLVSAIKKEFDIENVVTHPQKTGDFDIIVLLGDDYKSSGQ
ncbi:MAG: putative cell envelope-related function transcriptional attenuator [Firmicutes bacterium]|nr:putative cell envelope-related function transcriptional attenuator [Bacillota bacterium]